MGINWTKYGKIVFNSITNKLIMKITYTPNQRYGIWILAVGFTSMILSISLLSSIIPSGNVVVNSYAQQNEKIQNLTETNIPKVLPLVRGYADGNEVFYITTEVSDEKLANYLTNLTKSRVVYTPSLKYVPPQSLANIYEFTNGIKGSGPEGFQPNIADSQPGDNKYSPLWKVNLITWNNGTTPRELTSEEDIVNAVANNEITIKPTGIIVNCPFVQWKDGSLKVRENKMLTDDSPYGGGQVLDIDTEKMQVTFVAHRGFAPNGSTIYYIATDASVEKVADDLGVLFVNKTGPTLRSGASSDLYVFTNGIKGNGPMGYQASIASTNAGDEAYSPLWRIQTVTWKDPMKSEFLTSLNEITEHAKQGHLTIKVAGVVVNCPFVEV
ncbi:MAG TPA: hypothetical protein VFM31_03995 [Nitrososphaeraceae archaeon]|nr:hypothetical protein [Nitrososphaeraceae archaeon]